jgi:hypothetical protein
MNHRGQREQEYSLHDHGTQRIEQTPDSPHDSNS